ncbi:hypothetical protein [Streptomyces sp. NBC_00539]|uniref:hypothetical protein n=1 Tax=Streptomyces sp. NBC_00539 TaxID=2975770 RepID=UPI002E80580A|nr:hypothetical protein [Streptomyces sp. NBC_00539]WUC69202.1 hypothetical protein OG861_33740 [Streptomyces sp. NBC_00539]
MGIPLAAPIRWLGKVIAWGWRWWVPALAAAALLVMGEISQLLETLSTVDHFSYNAGALTGWPGLWPSENTDRASAVTAWNAWADDAPVGSPGREGSLKCWLRAYIALDFFVFAPAYTFGLYVLLRRILKFRTDQGQSASIPTDQGQSASIPFSVTGITAMVSALLLADLAETGATGFLVHAARSKSGVEAWASAVTWLSWLKWLLLGATVLLGVAVLVVDILPLSLTQWFTRWQCGELRPSRTWTRHRSQLAAVVVLAALIALPGGGPLEQVPDIQRSWVHDDIRRWHWLHLGDIMGPVITLAGLSLGLWVAGRWALLDRWNWQQSQGGASEDQDQTGDERDSSLRRWVAECWALLDRSNWQRGQARGKWAFLWLPLFAAVALLFLWPFWSDDVLHQPWKHNVGGLAIPIVALAISVLGILVRGDDPARRPVEAPSRRRRVATIGRALTVVPIMIAGLGLVRAFARPVLLNSLIESVPHGAALSWFWFVAGLVLAVILPPLVYSSIGWAEGRLFGEWEPATLVQTRRRARIPFVTGLVLILISSALGLLTAVDPLTWGAWLRTLGVLALLLTSVVLLCAWFNRCAETREPYRAFRALRFRYTPIWLPVLAVLAAQSMLDNSGFYHAVRLKQDSANTPRNIQPFSFQTEFDNWYEQVKTCRSRQPAATNASAGVEGNAIPMVFVAAAGGGIRAAYWTSSAMDQLTTASPCASSYTFGMSGVSGGSLGLAAHTLSLQASARAEAGRMVVRRMADEDALAADIAALLYRDGTHAFHGMNRVLDGTIGDRASVFERAWEKSMPGPDGWERNFFTATRPAPASTVAGAGWHPLLMLNGTDVTSGCRIAVSARWTTGRTPDETLRCQRAVVSHAGGGTQFATATVDAGAFTDSANCGIRDLGLRMSTAAHLSARFAYVSPSGTMYRCLSNDEKKLSASKKKNPDLISSIDGGYLENSGIAALLELWSAVEPAVAAHNQEARKTEGKDQPYVAPVLVFLDNHYSLNAPEPALTPLNELVVPLTGKRAAATAARTTTLQQAALTRFTGPLPGAAPGAELRVGTGPQLKVRSFLVAPRTQPQITAPLGWVLSEMSMSSMDRQMQGLTKPSRSSPSDGTTVTAGPLSDALRMLSVPLSVTAPPSQ